MTNYLDAVSGTPDTRLLSLLLVTAAADAALRLVSSNHEIDTHHLCTRMVPFTYRTRHLEFRANQQKSKNINPMGSTINNTIILVVRRYTGRKKKKEKNNPRRGGTHGRRNTQHCYSNEAIYLPTDSSTAERSTTTVVTPTTRSTHPLCITAVQQMTYRALLRSREKGETMGPENESTKHVKHPEPRINSAIHVLTHHPTAPTHQPNNPPMHQPTHTAEYSSSRTCVDDTNGVAVTLGFPCTYDYAPPRGVSTLFPERPPLAESFIGAHFLAANRRAVV